MNQDGASNGLTAPNGPSQQRVIRQALANARVSAAEVDVVEAHGTGTELGDPIEAQALLATYGQGRAAGRALWLGSVKSNIGHAQAAAGVAGVIKVVLALRHQLLPATLHAGERSPHVDWSAGQVALLTEAVPWPAGDRPRRAGVSSFGISGTNAHVIIEEAPPEGLPQTVPLAGLATRPRRPGRRTRRHRPGRPGGSQVQAGAEAGSGLLAGGAGVVAWLVSGRGAAGLRGQAGRLAGLAAGRPGLDVAGVARALAVSRSQLEDRAVVVGASAGELAAGLRAVAAGGAAAGVVTGTAVAGKVGFVFAGQGSQRAGAGRELYERSGVFAAAFDEVCGFLDPVAGRSLRDIAFGLVPEAGELIGQTGYAQPVLFAVQVALVRLLGSWGLVPDVVAGHSVGELAAAQVAGVMGLGQACGLVAARAAAMQALAGGGVMAAVQASEAEMAPVVEQAGPGVSIAAVNGPVSVVVSGDPGPVGEVTRYWSERGRRTRQLRVSHAFHSARMDPALPALQEAAARVSYAPPAAGLVLGVTGQLAGPGEVTASYWARQAREPVRFANAVAALAGHGATVIVEIGPDGTLCAMAAGCLDPGTGLVPVLRPGRGETGTVLEAAAAAWVRGAAVDWAAVLPAAARADLPTYAFQRRRYWPRPPAPAAPAGAGTLGEARFWQAVEAQDAAAAAAALGGDGTAAEQVAAVLPALAAWRRRERDQSAVEGWRYRLAWRPVPDPGPGVLAGTWLVAAQTGGGTGDGGQPGGAHPGRAGGTGHGGDGQAGVLAGQVAAALAAGGAQVVPVLVAAGAGRAVVAAAVAAAAGAGPVAGVVWVAAGDGDQWPVPGGAAVPAGLAGLLVLVQALGDVQVTGRLWCLTSGAVAAGAGDEVGLAQAAVWGLGRVAGLEHPGRWGGLIDVPPVLDGRAAARLCAVLAGARIRWRCGRAGCWRRGWSGRRRRRRGGSGGRAGWCWSPGGPGRWARMLPGGWPGTAPGTLVLASRRGPAAGQAAAAGRRVAGAGAAVTITACDAGDPGAVAGVTGWARARQLPLTAVIHAAGTPQARPWTRWTLPGSPPSSRLRWPAPPTCMS